MTQRPPSRYFGVSIEEAERQQVIVLSDARLRFCMELGTRMAVEQVEFAVRARMRRLIPSRRGLPNRSKGPTRT